MFLGNIISSSTGFVHLAFSIVALLTGTLVLIYKKGTRKHKIIGYCYAISMLGVLTTAFMIYQLYGTFGLFHWLAVVSSITLLGGMVPVLMKRPSSYISLHYNFMYWSVMGLYGAFAAETMVRIPDIAIESGIPNTTFYNMTGIAVGITMGLAAYFARKNKKKWMKFDSSLKE